MDAAWESTRGFSSHITLMTQVELLPPSPPSLPQKSITELLLLTPFLSHPLLVLYFLSPKEKSLWIPVGFHFVQFALSLSIVLSKQLSRFVSFQNLIYVLGRFPWCFWAEQGQIEGWYKTQL